MKTKIPLAQARLLAERCRAALAPHCSRIEIAGSIRRLRPEVGDIEIVCVPNPRFDLFGAAYWEDTPLHTAARKLGTPIKDGQRYKQLELPEGICLDLFIVLPPTQFGVQFLLRTGPAEFSRKMVTVKMHGGHLPNWAYVRDASVKHRDSGGEVCPTPEEADFSSCATWPISRRSSDEIR